MIILIGGVGCVGKTYMAGRLLERYKYPYLSVDHLKMGLYRADMGCGFTPDDDSLFIGEKLWPMIKGIIMTCVENEQNLIIEGIYLHPQQIHELKTEYLNKIISFYLMFSTQYIEKNFNTKIQEYRSVIEKRKYDNEDIMERYISENTRQKEICEKHHAKYFEIQDDYEKEIDMVYSWIDVQLCKRR